MNDIEPYPLDMPRLTVGDDLWRVEFVAPIDGRQRLIWSDNVLRHIAQFVLTFWVEQRPGRVIFCKLCPPGTNCNCPHEDTPGQRGWRSHEMSNVRIMPMREAV